MTSASELSFGTLGIRGTTVRLLGGASELDTEKLVEALATAKRIPALRIEKRIERTEARAAALEELRGHLARLRDAVEGLRNPPGALGLERNLFEKKDVFLSTAGPLPASDILSVQATARAQVQRFSLEVERIATAHKIRADAAASADQTLADAFNGGAPFSGSFTIGLAGGPTVTITVDGTTTLARLRDAIEAQSAVTGVRAALLSVGPGDVRLVLSARETGRAIALSAAGGDEVLERLGLLAGGSVKHELVAARTARFSIDGQVLERPSNLVTDALPGVTLNLFRSAPGQTVDVSVEPATAGVRTAIREFVEAYNALHTFARKHQTVSDTGRIAPEAVLFGDRLLRGALDGVDRILNSRVEGLGAGAFDRLAATGIRRAGTGELVLDEAALDRALAGDFEKLRELFEFRATTSSPELRVVARSNALADRSFTVAITDADDDGVPEAATIDGVAAVVEGRRIKGVAGTPYEGLELAWVGRGSQSIEVSFTQGLADRLFNLLDPLADAANGAIAKEKAALESDRSRLEQEIARIDERVERYRAQLYEKFAKLEQTLALTKTLLQQVEAQARAFEAKR
ncbi:MAG: flagellar filament capping protein FliD [Geminicoccaceae bacterium]|nr:flagellar filament capping protein FliD [Geminicoccaceae bacterium]MDW8124704.1 flagellar filament capping protein FliD [Geminicoccaceae bacterium]MDW8341531.1 flagellar filament capping protein FliD [Geminicoccaceae bacterium]